MRSKTVYKVLALLLIACMLFAVVPAGAGAFALDAAGTYENGTEKFPFLIKNDDDFDRFYQEILHGDSKKGIHYLLTADISYFSFPGIGSVDCPFEGTFDGGGHTFFGFVADYPDDSYVALFRVNRGTIRNLTVEGSMIASSNGSLLCGRNESSGVIENCRTAGLCGANQKAGGIAGENYGQIVNCVNEATVQGLMNVGGIVGYSGGTETDCVNYGKVIGNNQYIGGIVGSHSGQGRIYNCVNYGEVDASGGNMSFGGVVGEASCTVEYCRNYGKVSGNSYGGGITCANYGVVRNCINYGDVSGHNEIGGIVGFTYNSVENCENHGKITGDLDCGGIAGYSKIGDIRHCGNTGEIVGSDNNTAGIVGAMIGARTVADCFNTGKITGISNVGGIIGDANSSVYRSYNTGKITATGDNAGGIAGNADYGEIRDCFNSGNISAGHYAGGIVGQLKSALYNNLSIGKVTSSDLAGTIIGYRPELRTISRNYYYKYDGHPTGIGGWAGDAYQNEEIKGLTEDQYKNGENGVAYVDWDFDSVWYMTDGGPRLRKMYTIADNGVLVIRSAEDFVHFRDSVNEWGMTYKDVSVKLGADIDLSGVSDQLPVGYPAKVFEGVFNGQNHRITGVDINVSGNYAGLFCKVTGDVTDVHVYGNVTGGDQVGGIAADIFGNLRNSSFTGSVTGNTLVGGLAGWVRNGEISSCAMHGSVACVASGDDLFAGGIVGKMSMYCTLKLCESDASVSCPYVAGGIAGLVNENEYVLASSHVGSVYGGAAAGGVAGMLIPKGTIVGCYHYEGRITGIYTGGLLGALGYKSGVSNATFGRSYYLAGTVIDNSTQQAVERAIGIAISGNTPTGAAEQLSVSAFRNQNSFVQWDFTDVWTMSAARPVLKATHAKVTFDPNGGSGTMNAAFLAVGGGYLPHVTYTKNNCDFYGWNTAADCSGEFYEDQAFYNGTEDLTLYAVWLEIINVSFVDERDILQIVTCYVLPVDFKIIPSGWYCARGEITTSNRFRIEGDVKLILADDCLMYANSGISVAPEGTLTVYGQSMGYGSLEATGADYCAGIGGNASENGGAIIVNGGSITSHGGKYGAGIGGGDNGDAGLIIIRGGSVWTYGNEGAAGIGGGDYGNGGSVYISGGVVSARGSTRSTTGQASAGIGASRPRPDGSQPLDPGVCVITGGTVTASAGVPTGSGAGAQSIGVNNADVNQDDPAHAFILGDFMMVNAGPSVGEMSIFSYSRRRLGCCEAVIVIRPYLKYDVDISGTVSISDVTTLLDVLAGSATAYTNCDLNEDYSVTISDVTTLLDYLSHEE